MPIKPKKEDNNTHLACLLLWCTIWSMHGPDQLSVVLVCQSVKAKLYRLQILAHAYQQPASDVQISRFNRSTARD